MGSTQREEVVPAPPPYAATSQDPQVPSAGQTGSGRYAPPPGPPPPLDGEGQANGQANNEAMAPPPLMQAPPSYEPFSFANEYANQNAVRAPKWHGAPQYSVYHNHGTATLTFHLCIPSTEPPCACGADLTCQCGRRRPAIWQAIKRHGSKLRIELIRQSPCSGHRELAMYAIPSKKLTARTSAMLSVRSDKDVKLTQLARHGQGRLFRFVYGQNLIWTRHGDRLELTNAFQTPMAILFTNSVPARLDMTAFAWSRMPSDMLECDYDGCALRPLYGFSFRCMTCSEHDNDTFDVCEAHLLHEFTRHDQRHHFKRQPRPFADFDSDLRETPLLRMPDIEAQRQSQELVILTLACMLLDDR